MRQRDIRQRLLDLVADAPVRMSGREASLRIREWVDRSGANRRELRALWSMPRRYLGPFASLPPALKQALADAAAQELDERSFVGSDGLRRLAYGPVVRWTGELARLGWRLKSRGGRWRIPGRMLTRLGRELARTCERLGHLVQDARRFSPFARTSILHALWKWAGVDTDRLIQDFVDEVPCDLRTSPIGESVATNTASAALFGLDILPSGGELYFVEANSNGGLPKDYAAEDPEGGRVFRTLIDYARRRGFRRIVFFPSRVEYLRGNVEATWHRYAASRGIRFEVRDDPQLRSPYDRAFDPLVDPGAHNTLYVNGRSLPGPLATLVKQKGLMEREIERHNAGLPEDRRIPLPRAIRSPEDLNGFDPDTPFPNLIVKHRTTDCAAGLALYKTDRLPSGVLRPPFAAWEFLPPDCEIRQENGTRAEHAFRYRVYLLVTPHGPVYLDGCKGVAGRPIPSRLPIGPVLDPAPYVVNGHVGARHGPITAAEHQRLERVSLEIGRVILRFVRRKYAESDRGIAEDNGSRLREDSGRGEAVTAPVATGSTTA